MQNIFSMQRGHRRAARPGRTILLGFLFVILFGACLLHLPIAARDHSVTAFVDCLFTATSATCVTGLVVVDTWQHWTVFGQIVVLGLIQIGGLGVMSVTALVSFFMGRTITMRERLEMSASLSLDDISGTVRLMREVMLFTAAIELAGTALLSIRFIPQFGVPEGLWKAFFHAVSAFCNAGFDLMGQREAFSNLSDYAQDPLVNLVIIALIVMGGLGFLVWRDLSTNRKWNCLSVHTRLVLIMTALLLVGGTLAIFVLEYSNPQTLGNMPVGNRVLASLFQATTCRTAGFNTIDQGALRSGTAVICILLMFVGGSSGSTAGGIKTTSVAVLILAAWSALRSRRDITVFHRRIEERLVMQAVALVMAALGLILTGSFILYTADNVSVERALYETVSAFSTTGLSENLTPTLGVISKCWLILEMYLGRIGILTLGAAVFMRRIFEPKIRYPESKVIVG